MNRPLTVFVSAGEESGDRHGAGLVRALKRRRPDARIVGVGGPRMAEAGAEILFDPTAMAVMWFADVFRNLRTFVRLFEGAVRALGRLRPDVLVPIDYPGFNLRLADRAQGLDIPVAYYVSPQVWAWWPARVHRIAEVVDRMMVIFPFEESFYRAAGVDARYVGHPVRERLAGPRPHPEPLARAGIGPGREILALLPGSRRAEVRRNFPLMLEAARRVRRDRPALAVASAFSRPHLAEIARAIVAGAFPDCAVLDGDVHGLMAAARAALVCAGSATVELACLDVPMAVLYRVTPQARLLSALLNRSPHIAMVNLLAGRRLVPEFLLWRDRPELLAKAVAPLLEDGPAREAQRRGLAGVRDALGGPGASDRAAQIVLETALGG